MWLSLSRHLRDLSESDPHRVSIAEVSFRSMAGGMQTHSAHMFNFVTGFGLGDCHIRPREEIGPLLVKLGARGSGIARCLGRTSHLDAERDAYVETFCAFRKLARGPANIRFPRARKSGTVCSIAPFESGPMRK